MVRSSVWSLNHQQFSNGGVAPQTFRWGTSTPRPLYSTLLEQSREISVKYRHFVIQLYRRIRWSQDNHGKITEIIENYLGVGYPTGLYPKKTLNFDGTYRQTSCKIYRSFGWIELSTYIQYNWQIYKNEQRKKNWEISYKWEAWKMSLSQRKFKNLKVIICAFYHTLLKGWTQNVPFQYF